MTARDIQNRLIVDLYRRSFVIPNYTPRGWWECDIFELTPAGFFREYEIKVSVQDFKADASKAKTRWVTTEGLPFTREVTFSKHTMLAERSIKGPSNFWFVVPEGLIEAADVPEWAGLIYATDRPGHRAPFKVNLSEVKKAPRLHTTKAEKLKAHAESVCYYRMNNLYMETQGADPKVLVDSQAGGGLVFSV